MALLILLLFYSLHVVELTSNHLHVCPSELPVCDESNYTDISDFVTYVAIGSDVTVTCKHASLTTIHIQNLTGQPPNCEPSSDTVLDCSMRPHCTLDTDSGEFTITNFQRVYNGTYRCQYSQGLNDQCYVNFQLIAADIPSITDINGQERVIDHGSKLLLQPNISASPTGVISWFKNGQNLSHTANSFSIDAVTAGDRGNYTVTVSNIAGTISLEYTVLVNFSPEISLYTSPSVSSRDTTVVIHCKAIAYPEIDSIELLTRNNEEVEGAQKIISLQRQDNLHYEATLTYTLHNCLPMVYTCLVKNKNRTYNSSSSIGTCQDGPEIFNFTIDLATSTNVSVALTWNLKPPEVFITNYTFQYHLQDESDWISVLLHRESDEFPSENRYVIKGLTSGLIYSFRMKASNNKNESCAYIKGFRIYSAPQDSPKGLLVVRNKTGDVEEIILTWKPVQNISYTPVTYYEVVYYSSNNETKLVQATSNTYFKLTSINNSSTYFFRVRAVNAWGVSDLSAQVESRKIVKMDNNIINQVNVKISVEDGDTAVYIKWNITDSQYVQQVLIEINRIEIVESNGRLFRVAEFNPSIDENAGLCSNQLNSSDTYQFCVTAVLYGNVNKSDCLILTTGKNRVNLDQCQNPNVFPPWGIAVIVVGFVLIVFFVFGGLGLYFGIKHNKRGGADLYSPQPSIEGLPHLNGNYPYPTKRDTSPSRSCMAYRHNHRHEHGIDWRTNKGITEV